jgi:hypothetical protein
MGGIVNNQNQEVDFFTNTTKNRRKIIIIKTLLFRPPLLVSLELYLYAFSSATKIHGPIRLE